MTATAPISKLTTMSLVRNRTARGAIAIPALLLTSLWGVAAPLLERADVPTAPVLESEHDPGSCPAPHDHRLCAQTGANHSAPSGGSDATGFAAVQRAFGIEPARALEASAELTTPPARAPPSS